MRSPCYQCVSVSPSIKFRVPEQICMKLGMYVMAREPNSTVYFINPSHQSLCLYVYSYIVTRQRLGKHVPTTMNTRNNKITVGRVVFSADRVVSNESRRLVLP
jgi:hypothetical protein